MVEVGEEEYREESGDLRIDDMDDPVGDQKIWVDNLGAVDEDGTVGHADGQSRSVHCGKLGPVPEVGAVSDGSVASCEVHH